MNRAELNQLWNDDQNWYFYLSIYRCPQDPRIFVKKKDAAGWTFNFGHRASIPVFLFMLVTLFLPLLIMVFWRDDNIGVAATLGTTALVIAVWVPISIWNERRNYESTSDS